MKTSLPHLGHEKLHWGNKYYVIGIDEVGRGPLAGPVTVGGVCFSSEGCDELLDLGINDSKKLSEPKRQYLSQIIMKKALAYSIASSNVDYINTYGIVKSIENAVQEVVKTILKSLKPAKPVFLLLDQMSFFEIPSIQPKNMTFIVKGDSISLSIAAASIIAKVHRDNIMAQLSTTYPVYQWDKNKGYATLRHRNAIRQHKLSPFHRSLFVRNISI